MLWGAARIDHVDHNLIPWGIDFTEWFPSPTLGLAVGYTDPWGGPNGYLLTDNNGAGLDYLQGDIAADKFLSTGQKGVALFLKEHSVNPQVWLRDVTAGVNYLQCNVSSWTAGKPNFTMTVGTLLWRRHWGDGWYRCGFLSDAIATTANPFRLLIYGPTGVGSWYAAGAQVTDVPYVGGFVATSGASRLNAGVNGQHLLRAPVQKLVPGGDMWRMVRESGSRRFRDVVTVGPGVEELAGEIRYIESPQEVSELIRAGMQGHPLVYIPDTADPDTAYECELVEPSGMDWQLDQDVDWPVFREPKVAVRLRLLHGSGTFEVLL